MIVVDTNVIFYLYVKEDNYTAPAENLFSKDPDWAAPYLWRSEFRNVLSVFIRKKKLNLENAILLAKQSEIQMKNREYFVSGERVLELVNNSSCSAYDCEFVALAKELEIPFVTSDRKIVTEFPEIAFELTEFVKK